MKKRGLTAREAIRLLSPDPSMVNQSEIGKSDWELWSGRTAWVNEEYYQKLGTVLLLDVIADGMWHAKGHRRAVDGNKQAEYIPTPWGDLAFFDDDNTVVVGGIEYHDVLYYEGRHKPVVSTASAKTRCFEWLVEELKAKRTKRKVDYQDEADAEREKGGRFEGLSKRSFLLAWEAARKEPDTHESWKKARGPVGSL